MHAPATEDNNRFQPVPPSKQENVAYPQQSPQRRMPQNSPLRAVLDVEQQQQQQQQQQRRRSTPPLRGRTDMASSRRYSPRHDESASMAADEMERRSLWQKQQRDEEARTRAEAKSAAEVAAAAADRAAAKAQQQLMVAQGALRRALAEKDEANEVASNAERVVSGALSGLRAGLGAQESALEALAGRLNLANEESVSLRRQMEEVRASLPLVQGQNQDLNLFKREMREKTDGFRAEVGAAQRAVSAVFEDLRRLEQDTASVVDGWVSCASGLLHCAHYLLLLALFLSFFLSLLYVVSFFRMSDDYKNLFLKFEN